MVHSALCSKTKSYTDEPAINYGTWYLDSGADDHMTSRRGKLTNFKKSNSRVEVANKEMIEVAGTGTAEFKLCEANGGLNFTLENVLFVPDLEDNLLSIGRIEERGFKVIFADGKATVSNKNGEILITAKRKGRLYAVEECRPSARTVKNITESKLHRRMGHLHMDAVKNLIEDNKESNYKQGEIPPKCSTCILGKMKRSSFPRTGATRAKEPLELIHSDVVGKIEPTSKGGSKYFVTFIDDYSRHVTVYPMKRKDEVLQKFDEYRQMAEKLHGNKVKMLRSDNGGEYRSKEFDRYVAKHGIRRQLTVPGTPQQNGVAERMNQTLMDMTRCLLIESNVTKALWADALDTACHIRNRCPSSAIKGKLPETLWSGKEANVDHLRVFGCKAWSAVNRRWKRGKLDPKSIECVFIGYPSGVKGYKLWDIENDRFFVSCDVTFEEEQFPCKRQVMTKDRDAIQITNTKSDICFGSAENSVTDVQLVDEVSLDSHQRQENHQVENVTPPTNIETVSTEKQDVEQTQRRSKRLENKRTGENKSTCCKTVKHQAETDPENVEEAMLAPDGENWKEAMREELNNLENNGTWILVPRPTGRNVVKNKWVFKKKHDADGNLDRYKARLVARGYTQVRGIDYKETYSPVVKTKSIRILLALAVERNWEAHQLDITAAYLNGTLKETIYMEQPKPFVEEGKEDHVCLLQKSLYGLHQSGREWNTRLDEFLKSTGLIRSKADPCVYINVKQDFIVGVYVDDLLMIAKEVTTIDRFKKEIGKAFNIKDIGLVNHIISMRVLRRNDGTLTMDQSIYAEELLKNMEMDQIKGAATPLDPGMKYGQATEETVGNEELTYKYRQAIGGLLYLAGGTRPDLAHATAYMSQFNNKPSKEHWAGVKHIMRYVRQTTDWGLTFKRSGRGIEVFADADWANDKIDRRSFSGYVVMLAGTAISWSSKKQRTTALSTVEAEYLAMCHAAKEVLWLRNLLTELGAEDLSATPQILQVDNQGAMALARNQITSERNKHIELRHFFLREKVETKQLKFEYVPTADNHADIMTKILNGPKNRSHNIAIGLRPILKTTSSNDCTKKMDPET